jgi:hypothetical protein
MNIPNKPQRNNVDKQRLLEWIEKNISWFGHPTEPGKAIYYDRLVEAIESGELDAGES